MNLSSFLCWLRPLFYVYILINYQPSWASKQCREIILNLNQSDPIFKAAGLFSKEGESLLCGHTCILKAVAQLGLGADRDVHQQLINMVTNEFPAWGMIGTQDRGVNIHELNLALHFIAKKYGQRLEVKTKHHKITEEDLLEANKPDTIVIGLLGTWDNISRLEQVDRANVTTGHYTIISGTKKITKNKYIASLNDPQFGNLTQELAATFIPSRPKNLQFRVKPIGSDPHSSPWVDQSFITLLTHLIIVRKADI